MRASILAISTIFAVHVSAQTTDNHAGERLKSSVVVIHDDDQRKLGSGAWVNTDGLILTAKHILELPMTGQSAPRYLLSVYVQKREDTKLWRARLLATHPHMDLAILQSVETSDEPIVPLLIDKPPEPSNSTWYAIGHPYGFGEEAQKFYVATGNWAEVDRKEGRIVLESPTDNGMSGGPLVVHNKLVGVLSHSDSTNSFAEPVTDGLEFFTLLGFQVEDSGLMAKVDHLGTLATRVRTYERILGAIQADLKWSCELFASWNFASPSGLPESVVLSLLNEKRLQMQPDIHARVSLELGVSVNAPERSEELAADGLRFVGSKSTTATFDGILHQLRVGFREKGLDVQGGSIEYLDAKLTISDVLGEEYLGTEIDAYSVCCRFSDLGGLGKQGDSRFVIKETLEAKRCPLPSNQTTEP